MEGFELLLPVAGGEGVSEVWIGCGVGPYLHEGGREGRGEGRRRRRGEGGVESSQNTSVHDTALWLNALVRLQPLTRHNNITGAKCYTGQCRIAFQRGVTGNNIKAVN